MFNLTDIENINKKNETSKPTAKPKASSFAEYVYWETKGKFKRKQEGNAVVSERLKSGRNAHLSINELTKTEGYKNEFGNISASEWELIFVDEGQMKGKCFINSQLTLNGEPLNCIPDVIFRYKNTKSYLIIENKSTRIPAHHIPEQGWPNVKAQLWVYSWMDALLEAERVYMASKYWTWDSKNNLIPIQNASHLFPVFERGNTEHESLCIELFNKWGGEINMEKLEGVSSNPFIT